MGMLALISADGGYFNGKVVQGTNILSGSQGVGERKMDRLKTKEGQGL